MKFVKGVATFLVLCLAMYGAYALLKRPPQLDVPESDRGYLEEIGIHIHDTQAADSGLSGILSDVEGVVPVGVPHSPFGGMGSSTPPSFLAGPTASSTPPAFISATPIGTAPRVAANAEPQIVSDVFQSAIEVLPPPTYSEPVDFPIQVSPAEVLPPKLPSFETVPFDTSSFDAPPLEVLAHPAEVLSVSATESPPPWAKSWDGPSSGILTMPPPAEILQTLTSSQASPNPIANILSNALPHAHNPIAQSAEESIRRIEENVRKIESDMEHAPVSVLEESKNQDDAFSSSNNIPLEAATIASTRYTMTSSRQPLTFEPVKPEVSPTAPIVTFAPPKRPHPQSDQIQEPTAIAPASVVSAAVGPEVRQIGTPRLIERTTDSPAMQAPVQPAVREAIERFVRMQRQLAETGVPENIRQAFIQLSKLYELEQLEDAERALMRPVLDVLALRVIYARETNILEPSYRVKPGETVESIAKNFNLTPALLRKINGLGISQELSAGMALKVVEGQFDARISMRHKELTLLLGGLYAGQFSFSLPNEGIPVRKGEFYVTNRSERMVVLNNGWVLATDYARNATIIFSDRDAREIFDILSEQSVIVIE